MKRADNRQGDFFLFPFELMPASKAQSVTFKGQEMGQEIHVCVLVRYIHQ